MFSRAGYDLTFSVDVPTPMIAMLSVRPSRQSDLKTPHRIVADRLVAMEDYVDGFSNIFTRLTVPAGSLTLFCDFVIEDRSDPDR